MSTTEQIKNRKSYQMFKRMAKSLKENDHEETLKLIHKSIDDRRGYGSETNSNYAEQSLNLVIDEEFH